MLISTAQYTHCRKTALHAAAPKLLRKRSGIVTSDGYPPDSSPTFSAMLDFVNHSCFETMPSLASEAQALLFLAQLAFHCFFFLFLPFYQLLTVGVASASKSLSLAPTSLFSSRFQQSAIFLHLLVARGLKLTMWQIGPLSSFLHPPNLLFFPFLKLGSLSPSSQVRT